MILPIILRQSPYHLLFDCNLSAFDLFRICTTCTLSVLHMMFMFHASLDTKLRFLAICSNIVYSSYTLEDPNDSLKYAHSYNPCRYPQVRASVSATDDILLSINSKTFETLML